MTPEDIQAARDAMVAGHDACKMIGHFCRDEDVHCNCDLGKIDGCKARVEAIAAAIAKSRVRRSDMPARTTVVGNVTGKLREGDQVPGMPGAICHACGLGYKCTDPDCPNDKPNPMFEVGR